MRTPASVFVTVSMEISRRGRREQLRAPLRPSSTARCWRLLFSRPGRRCRSPGRRRRPPTPPPVRAAPAPPPPPPSSSLQSSQPPPLLRLLPLLRRPPRSRARTPSLLGDRRVCVITLRQWGGGMKEGLAEPALSVAGASGKCSFSGQNADSRKGRLWRKDTRGEPQRHKARVIWRQLAACLDSEWHSTRIL